MRILLAALCGFGLDLLLGDPEKLAPLHPVVLMGKAIQALETGLRARFPAAERGELAAGRVLAGEVGTESFELHGMQVKRADVGCAAFLLD